MEDDLKWLREQFDDLSHACQNEYGFDGDGYGADRERAKLIFDEIERRLVTER